MIVCPPMAGVVVVAGCLLMVGVAVVAGCPQMAGVVGGNLFLRRYP
jgi:hypothetical protein